MPTETLAPDAIISSSNLTGAVADIQDEVALGGIVTTGLVGAWPFDDGSGQQLTDIGPNGYHGRLGTTTGSDADDPTWATEGLSFAGSHFVELPSIAIPQTMHVDIVMSASAGSMDWSLVVYFGWNGTTAPLQIFKRQNTSWMQYWVDYTGGGSATGLFGVRTVFDSTYHHIVIEINGTAFAAYVDGVEDYATTLAALPIANTAISYVGFKPSSAALTGTIAYMTLYNQVLATPGANYSALQTIMAARGVTI